MDETIDNSLLEGHFISGPGLGFSDGLAYGEASLKSGAFFRLNPIACSCLWSLQHCKLSEDATLKAVP